MIQMSINKSVSINQFVISSYVILNGLTYIISLSLSHTATLQPRQILVQVSLSY